jgi:hypothetical protein
MLRKSPDALGWTAPAQPAGAQWALITFRSVAVQAAPEVFSRAGTDALTAGYEALWTPELKQLLRANWSDLFVDSHATDPRGTPLDLWSSNMARPDQPLRTTVTPVARSPESPVPSAGVLNRQTTAVSCAGRAARAGPAGGNRQ